MLPSLLFENNDREFDLGTCARRQKRMGIEDALLHDILPHPDDGAPRLIFADWLDEHNDPRGEFIRVQCALADAPALHEVISLYLFGNISCNAGAAALAASA